ncbi:IQ-DOMAIN 14-like protein isoform X2 [Tanacetum coccineum]
MGKVTRWFRGVLGMEKDKVNIDNCNAKTKKRWSFGKCMKDLSQRVTVENDSIRMRSCMSASKKNKISMLLMLGQPLQLWPAHKLRWLLSDLLATTGILYLVARKNRLPPRFSPSIEVTCYAWLLLITTYCIMELMELHDMMQVVVINCHSFHRLKARRALRELKGLVKFQALVRGFLVRKRVAATLYSMQALLRAQLAVRSKRAELAIQPEIRHGKSTIEHFELNPWKRFRHNSSGINLHGVAFDEVLEKSEYSKFNFDCVCHK